MKQILKDFTAEIKKVTPNAHHGTNRDKVVIYPYVVYDFQMGEYQNHQEGVEVTFHIIDYASDASEVYVLEQRIRDHFHKLRTFTDGHYYQYEARTSVPVETTDTRIIRRDLTIFSKIDWRNKSWQEIH